MLTGKMTDLSNSNVYVNGGITSAILDVPYGYYYYGVKAGASKSNKDNKDNNVNRQMFRV